MNQPLGISDGAGNLVGLEQIFGPFDIAFRPSYGKDQVVSLPLAGDETERHGPLVVVPYLVDAPISRTSSRSARAP